MPKRLREWWRLAFTTPYMVVMRHAETSDSSYYDENRDISDQGRKQAYQAAITINERFKAHGGTFTVYSSHSIRAQQTAQIIAGELSTAVATVAWLSTKVVSSYGDELGETLQTLPRDCVPILVTHLPQVTQLTQCLDPRHAEPIVMRRPT